ncbi:hypothetical protein LDENG_00058650 [Lucifuga dentata]|nr:hypothetical protein LDENG_00058650 [Lucifuga dentata]
MGGLEPIPAVIGREARYTLDRSPVYRRADTETDKHIHALIHTYGQFRVPNSPDMHVFGGSRSTRREPTRTRGEHANSTQKGPDPAGNQTQDLLAVRQQR